VIRIALVFRHLLAWSQVNDRHRVRGSFLGRDANRNAPRPSPVARRQMQQQHVARRALHQGADGGFVVLADQEIALPVSGNSAVFTSGGRSLMLIMFAIRPRRSLVLAPRLSHRRGR